MLPTANSRPSGPGGALLSARKPKFLIDRASGRLTIFTSDSPLTCTASQVIISMMMPPQPDDGTTAPAVLTEEMPDGQRAP